MKIKTQPISPELRAALFRDRVVTLIGFCESNGVPTTNLQDYLNQRLPADRISEALDEIDQLLQCDTKKTLLDQPSQREWVMVVYDQLAAEERTAAN